MNGLQAESGSRNTGLSVDATGGFKESFVNWALIRVLVRTSLFVRIYPGLKTKFPPKPSRDRAAARTGGNRDHV
jgi:hypothetical protein